MKMLYIINTRHDADAYRVYARVHMDARVTPLTQAFSLISGLVILAGGVMAVVNQGPRLLYLATILVGLLFLLGKPLGLWRMQNRLLKNARDIQMKIDYRFGPGAFEVAFPGESQSIAYGDVTRIVETAGYYFLYTDVRMAHILPKKDFTQGDAAGFGAFVSEKSGVAVTRHKAK